MAKTELAISCFCIYVVFLLLTLLDIPSIKYDRVFIIMYDVN